MWQEQSSGCGETQAQVERILFKDSSSENHGQWMVLAAFPWRVIWILAGLLRALTWDLVLNSACWGGSVFNGSMAVRGLECSTPSLIGPQLGKIPGFRQLVFLIRFLQAYRKKQRCLLTWLCRDWGRLSVNYFLCVWIYDFTAVEGKLNITTEKVYWEVNRAKENVVHGLLYSLSTHLKASKLALNGVLLGMETMFEGAFCLLSALRKCFSGVAGCGHLEFLLCIHLLPPRAVCIYHPRS